MARVHGARRAPRAPLRCRPEMAARADTRCPARWPANRANGAAESWTNSADGRTWTFRIRPAARWSNGDPVTARDFLFSYER
ncbi:MAG: hypothetical protein EBS99_01445, partial [Betaproteobacteria bacterium]|nr:hypothetical protein [Betaproteobacteria bacterium]